MRPTRKNNQSIRRWALACGATIVTAIPLCVGAQPPQGAATPTVQAPAVAYTPPAKRPLPPSGLAIAEFLPAAKTPTPRTPDGHPDLNGIWGGTPVLSALGAGQSRGLFYFESDQNVVIRMGSLNPPPYRPEAWDRVNELNYGIVTDDPEFTCNPDGLPRMGPPQKIVLTSLEAVFVNGDEYRIIPLDGRKHTEEDKDYDTFGGIPVGHWEGDTLVVESIGFNDVSWLGFEGWFHTHDMKVTERITRKGDVLIYDVTVTDPEVFYKPWVMNTRLRGLNRNPNARIEEVAPCHERDVNSIPDLYMRG